MNSNALPVNGDEMNQELLILRHGSTKKKQSDDLQRSLRTEGRRDAQRLGLWLLQNELLPTHIISSTAAYAVSSAEHICRVAGLGLTTVEKSNQLDRPDRKNQLAALTNRNISNRMLLYVPHKHAVMPLLQYLLAENMPVYLLERKIAPATLFRLQLPSDWHKLQSGSARLLQVVTATDLPQCFPYVGEHGIEWRLRPAYYYTQSAVVPFRIIYGVVQILIVTSSKQNHWVIPKGIKEPDLSLQQSAQQEALEEAGVSGQLHEQPLGEYQYQKWGATCTVTVYAMKVTSMLNNRAWQESHRGREWVSVALAKKRLLLPQLHEMIDRLLTVLVPQ